MSARILASIRRKPWVLEVRDLWPESIVAVGALKRGGLYRFLERIELHLYRSATAIMIVSEAFRPNLTGRGIAGEKIFTVPNGADLTIFQPRAREAALVAKLGVEGKFVIGFIGTLGMAHGLDFILDCATELAARDVHLLFIGDGAKKASLVARAGRENLSNVTFCDPIAREDVPVHLAVCDSMLVNLKRSQTFMSVIPSKMFEAAAMGRPMLLGVDGIAREIVEEYDAGIYFEPEDRAQFLAAVTSMKEDRARYARLQEGCIRLARAYDRTALAAKALAVVRSAIGGKTP